MTIPDLNKYQQAAVESERTDTVVIAAPGTGKTRTLAARYRYMLNTVRALPSTICVLTFTRYAANELRARLGAGTGASHIGTFHSLCLKLVQQYGRLRLWDPEWMTILDEGEAHAEQCETLREVGLLTTAGWRHKGSWKQWDAFNSCCRRGEPVKTNVLTSLMGAAYRRYRDRLHAENCLTYDTLLEEGWMLAVKDMAYEHILVDEAQDCDIFNWRIIRMLDPTTTWVVGDVDQSIYQWRDACPDHLIELAQPAMCMLPLTYRFGPALAEMANRLIAHNSKRLAMTIEARPGDETRICSIPDLMAAADRLADRATALGPNNVVLLARTHAVLDDLALLMAEHHPDLKVEHVGGKTSVVNTPEFRAVRGYLRLAVNPLDRQAFAAIATSEHLSASQLWDIRAKASRQHMSMPDAYQEKLPMSGLKVWDPPGPVPVDRALVEIESHLTKRDPKQDYGPCLAYLRRYAEREVIQDAAELVRSLALDGAQERLADAPEDTIRLMTIHAAKGLEWPCVVLLTDGMPSKRSVQEGLLEEERRLCYVAMTRAQSELHMQSSGQFWGETFPEKSG